MDDHEVQQDAGGQLRLCDTIPEAARAPRVLGAITRRPKWGVPPPAPGEDDGDDVDPDDGMLADDRAEAAVKVCEAVEDMARADLEGPSLAAGWAILS
eukprot:8011148-Lingulodinium_polyedra.AAC.1